MNHSDENPQKTTEPNPVIAFLLGLFVACLVGALTLFCSQRLLLMNGMDTAIFIASQFTAIPILMGCVATFFWRKFNDGITRDVLGALCLSVLGLGASYFFLGEGTICLIMAFPLLFLFMWLGVALGKLMWKRSSWLQVSVIPLLAAALIADSRTPHQHSAAVTTRIKINASPAHVWQYVAEYPAIESPPDYWLWKLGLPAPLQSTSDGPRIGARRDCKFSDGFVFEEKIVEALPEKRLTFDITKQPDHPEINGHFNLDRGQLELQANNDGSTTLIGTSWYRLHVYPSDYFDLWAEDVIRHVHLRVMNRMKELAERDARNHHRILNETNPNTT